MQRFLILFLFFIVPGFSFSQSSVEETMKLLDDKSIANTQEKIYLHTDKASYTTGETIWFKLYSTIGTENFLSNFSKIAYVQLIDPYKNIVKEVKIPVLSGISMGDVLLTDTLTEGSYHLRAYTNWMRNFDEAYFFDRVINISNGRSDNTVMSSTLNQENNQSFYTISLKTLAGNPLSKTSVQYIFNDKGKTIDKGKETTDENGVLRIKLSEKTKNIPIQLSYENQTKNTVKKTIVPKNFESKNSVQVFPEGGSLLPDFLNKVAFKSLRPDGLAAPASIYLFNRNQDTVGHVKTNELGMGSISFIVEKGQSYSAKAIFDDQSTTSIDLPASATSGYSIMVNNFNDQKIYAQVNLSEDLIQNKPIYFIVQSLGKVFYISKQNSSKSELVFSASKAEFPSGILTISILNEQFKPLIERAVFNFNRNGDLPVALSVDNQTAKPKSKVTTTIHAENTSDSVFYTFLSASVVNMKKISDDLNAQPNIYSDLLLNADLKGHIESPGHYFENIEQIKLQELDDLVLTQGWRKINFNELATADSAKAFVREEGLSIMGYARKLGRKAPVPKANVKLISTVNVMDYIDTLANDEGYFVFDNLLFPDSVKFILTAEDEKGKKNIDIFAEKETYPSTLKNKNSLLEKNDVNEAYLADINASKEFFAVLENKGLLPKSIEIEEVLVRRERPKASPNSANLNGPGRADQVITAEDLETCATLEMCLAGRLTGVVFQGGIPFSTRGMTQMQVVLDGMYIEGDQLSMVNINDIQSVEVLRSPGYTAIYGSYGGGGLLVLTSKTGADAIRNYTPKGILTITPQGITPAKEFYKPVYEVGSDKTYATDLRTTIHWEPNIVMDKSGKVEFDFYTSDEAGTYRVTLEGIDLNGKIGRKIVEFEVK
ncbi:TonB-dependent receptor plug domain-containing protein [Sphingobacterium hungaricum]